MADPKHFPEQSHHAGSGTSGSVRGRRGNLMPATDIPAADLVEKLKDRGVLVLANAPDAIRAVTHLGVTSGDIEEAVGVIGDVLEAR